MAVTYKDIGDLLQKDSVAGTEKIVVSDTEYITPLQIAAASLPLSGGTMTGAITPSYDDQGAQAWTASKMRANFFYCVNTPNQTLISSAGWYRVWVGSCLDTQATSVIMHLTKTFNSGGSEAYSICVSLAGNGTINITQLAGAVQTTQDITKIRVVYTYNTRDALFIDLYYNRSATNPVNVYGFAGKGQFQAPTAVSGSVSNSVEFELKTAGFASSGAVRASSLIKTGGTSTQFLKADGSVDSTAYMAENRIRISSSEPTSSDGSDGDIWIVI